MNVLFNLLSMLSLIPLIMAIKKWKETSYFVLKLYKYSILLAILLFFTSILSIICKDKIEQAPFFVYAVMTPIIMVYITIKKNKVTKYVQEHKQEINHDRKKNVIASIYLFSLKYSEPNNTNRFIEFQNELKERVYKTDIIDTDIEKIFVYLNKTEYLFDKHQQNEIQEVIKYEVYQNNMFYP